MGTNECSKKKKKTTAEKTWYWCQFINIYLDNKQKMSILYSHMYNNVTQFDHAVIASKFYMQVFGVQLTEGT